MRDEGYRQYQSARRDPGHDPAHRLLDQSPRRRERRCDRRDYQRDLQRIDEREFHQPYDFCGERSLGEHWRQRRGRDLLSLERACGFDRGPRNFDVSRQIVDQLRRLQW